MKRKVLHVINSITTGGAENLLVNSLSPGGLQEYADNVLVYFNGISHLEKRVDPAIPVYSLNYGGLRQLPKVLLRLRNLIREHKIDVVHSHLTPSSFYTEIACPAEISHIHTVHTTYSMDTEARPWMRYLEKQLYFTKKKANVILLSDFTKEDFLKNIDFKGKTFVLNNFVPDAFFSNTSSPFEKGRALKLVAAGYLKELKNFEYLLEVFSYLKDQDISLDIYGGGDATPYEKIIQEQGLKIRMMGSAKDMSVVLPGYDLFIMPSKFEGFPLALFEAMASGLPVMLSDIPPLKSIVKNNGIYFALDNPAAVAETIRSIWNGDIDINSIAARARVYSEKTVRRDIYINKLINIYQML